MLHAFKNRQKPYFLGIFRIQADRAYSASIRQIPSNSGKTVIFGQLFGQLFPGSEISSPLTILARSPIICGISKSPSKSEPTGYPEFAVRAEVIGRFFSPPLASSTFHDFVNKGKIVPMKNIRGLYFLNEEGGERL